MRNTQGRVISRNHVFFHEQRATLMRQVLVTGNQSFKIVRHYKHPKMQAYVTPLLVLEDTKNVWGEPEVSMGILLQCIPITLIDENNDAEKQTLEPCETFSGLPNRIDLVRGWRALMLVESMPQIDDRFFFLDIYTATEHDEQMSTYHQEIKQEVRAEFEDPQTYDEIMARTVPMTILQLVIHMADAGTKELDLDSITDEIEHGTVRWSQELKRIGVDHPDYRRAMAAAKDQIVARYTRYLFSYAAHSQHPYDQRHELKSFIMLIIEWHLVRSIECGIEYTYGTDIVAMLAILTSEIECDDVHEELEKKHPTEESEGRHPFTRPTPEHVIDDTITWFFNSFCDDPLSAIRSQESCKALLQHLYQQWHQLPVTHPLVS